MKKQRCKWVADEVIYQEYHDEEWGSGQYLEDDQYLFEMLILEGAQAGLSWSTILKRRENYRAAFSGFDPVKVSQYGADKIAELLLDESIIRNKLKVASAVVNAKAFLQVQAEYGSFHAFLKGVIGDVPLLNEWETHDDVPAQTEKSVELSKLLKSYGFSFVGPVICYSFMQATGLVNDHTKDCYLYQGD